MAAAATETERAHSFERAGLGLTRRSAGSRKRPAARVRASCVRAQPASAGSLRRAGGEGEGQVLIPTMGITQFQLFKVCTCLATVFSFLKRLIRRPGRGRKLSGDQRTLPTTVDYSSVPKQTDVEEWTSWDEDAPTSVKTERGNGNVATQQNALEQLEPDYFKDMTPTIRKTQKIIIKKREPLNFGIPDGSTGFSSRLAVTQDMPFIHQCPELGDLDTWQENTNAWEEEEDAAWQAKEVPRQQKREKREQQNNKGRKWKRKHRG